MTTETFDLVATIIAFESGELAPNKVLQLFSHLIRNNMHNTLQGSYGRAAASLVRAGYLDTDGTILREATA
jgi:hypothetical protein